MYPNHYRLRYWQRGFCDRWQRMKDIAPDNALVVQFPTHRV